MVRLGYVRLGYVRLGYVSIVYLFVGPGSGLGSGTSFSTGQ